MPYTFYIDDSGQVVSDKIKVKSSPFYILAALGLNINRIYSIYSDIRDLIDDTLKYVGELKASELFNYKGKYRKCLPKELDARIEYIDNFIETILDILVNESATVIISAINNVECILRGMTIIPEIGQYKSFIHLIERIQKFLEKKNDFGWVMMDISGISHDIKSAYPDLVSSKYLAKGSYIKITRVLDTIAFADSRASYGVQIADLISYLFNQWLKRQHNYRIVRILYTYPNYLKKWIDIIKDKLIDRCPNGRIIGCGIKIYP